MNIEGKTIWLICQNFPPETVGGASRNYDIFVQLTKLGANVITVCGIPTYPFGSFKREYLFFSYKKRKINKLWTWQPLSKNPGSIERILYHLIYSINSYIFLLINVKKNDIVLTSQPPDTNLLQGYLIKKIKNVLWVTDIRDLWQNAAVDLGFINEKGLAYRSMVALKLIAYQSVDVIGSVNSHITNDTINNYGVSKCKIIPNPNGVDLDKFYPLPFEKKPMFIFVGNLGYSHNVDQIINLIKLIYIKNKKYCVLIAGEGERFEESKNILQNEESSGHVIFKGNVQREKLPELISQSLGGLIFHPNTSALFGAMPIKAMEYLACGIPIIGMADEGTKQIIENNALGYIESNGDINEVVKFLDSLEEEFGRTNEIGKKCREYVMQNYDRKILTKSFWEKI